MGLTDFPLGGYAYAGNLVSAALDDIEDTTPVLLIPAPTGINEELYITTLSVTNNHDTVSTVVKLTDGLNGETKWRANAAKEGGGFALDFPAPLMFSAKTAIYVVCETTGAKVQVSACGFKA
jgi:hypothetical protein